VVAGFVLAAMIPVFDVILNVSFNFLNGSTDIAQVGAIKLLLGLFPLFIVLGFIVLIFNSIFRKPIQEEL